MKLFFEPLDFLFFRDGRPFSGGESFAGFSRELPLPSVLYGAIRSRLLEEGQVDFARFASYTSINMEEAVSDYPVIELTGLADKPGKLQMHGPYFARLLNDRTRLDEVYFPLPLDVVKQKSDYSEYNQLEPNFAPDFKTNFPLSGLLPLKPKVRPGIDKDTPLDKADRSFCTRGALESYLNGDTLTPVKDDFSYSEPRIGIRMNEKNVTEAGQFYLLEGRRLDEGYGLLVELAGFDVDPFSPAETFFHLGGERRFSRVVSIEEETIPEPPPSQELAKYFKLLLVTPALFKNGWLPGWLDPQTGEGIVPSAGGQLKVKLIAAAVGRPVTLSGFDLARRQPKPTRRAVPAGSVYYFELLSGSSEELVQQVHNHSISDEESQAGFGVTFVGTF